MSTHPPRCRVCRGCGHTDGEPIWTTNMGRPHKYTTVTPCTHDWWNDDDGYDPYRQEPLDANNPKAMGALTEAYAVGRAELWEMSGGKLGAPLTDQNERDEVA